VLCHQTWQEFRERGMVLLMIGSLLEVLFALRGEIAEWSSALPKQAPIPKSLFSIVAA